LRGKKSCQQYIGTGRARTLSPLAKIAGSDFGGQQFRFRRPKARLWPAAAVQVEQALRDKLRV
jgi:hypothetical protein